MTAYLTTTPRLTPLVPILIRISHWPQQPPLAHRILNHHRPKAEGYSITPFHIAPTMFLRRPPNPSICIQCLHQLSTRFPVAWKRFSTTVQRNNIAALPSNGAIPRKGWQGHYFLSNAFLGKRSRGDIVSAPSSSGEISQGTPNPSQIKSEILSESELLPHRRRQRRRRLEADKDSEIIPPDASSLLSTQSEASPERSLKRTALSFLALTKPRLTALIVLTTMASYALFPVDPLLMSNSAPSLSALTLVFLTTGTALSSACANTLNMYLEPAFDKQMSRTRNRPLVRGLLSGKQALIFAAVTGGLGVTSLYVGVNPTVATLGALNIILYAGVYTPMKRISVINTWVGAIVGGIPPLMGWAAASGATATDGTWTELLAHPGGWLLAGLLFAWQFPHFNALSWTIKDEYRRAGYQMMAWKYPRLNARVSLRYSLLFFPICAGLWWCGVTDMGFLVDSSIVNAWLVRESWRFYRKGGEGGNAKRLFWASVWHLPLVMGLAMVHKAGLWRGVWERIAGVPAEEEE
ncbi:Protoheme IX farnesyltransferase, mitochondrial [Rhizina undulata]